MNHGGEPGHDDYGLPRVDIQIPDDARELDRDVQAYHRELRALRRHQRSLRWRAPLRRSGMVVPLIAGCLVLAMVAGVVLTMFSANPYLSSRNGLRAASQGVPNTGQASSRAITSPAAPSAARNRSDGPASTAARLPSGTINVTGQRVDLSTVESAVLAIIPANCGCAGVIRRLVSQAMAAAIPVYLVGRRGTRAQLSGLAPDAAKGTTAFVAIDPDNVLSNAYPATGLTVVLVDAQHKVRRAALHRGFQLQSALRQLAGTR